MKPSLSLLVAPAALALGCNLQLVGGQCLDGYDPVEGHCVARDDGGNGAGGVQPSGGADAGGGGAGQGGTAGAAEGGAGGVGGAGGAGGGTSCEPLTSCNGECVDTDSDPLNCGSCGHGCQTGLCGGGQCQGDFAGHVVAIGIDYEPISAQSSAAHLLGNAVFLHPNEPVRVTLFTEYALANVSDKLTQLIAGEAQARGRTIQISSCTSPSDLEQAAVLLETDVILVPPQPMAGAGQMATNGSAWATPLTDFTGQGGVLIVLAQGAGSSELLSASQLLGPVEVTAQPMQSLSITSWIDSLSVGILSPFALTHSPTGINPTAPLDGSTQIVASTQTDVPVVVHRVVVPGG